ncbi:hypothetical protein F4778DRAFT_263716 [Xylariomycetidae sp. FL2044]|nr:hypothetical protein F4778DRAFT_263716 [Xylariomycetidae sp. FL2044]
MERATESDPQPKATALQVDRPGGATTFHGYSKLPPELRTMIWSFAPSRSIIEVRQTRGRTGAPWEFLTCPQFFRRHETPLSTREYLGQSLAAGAPMFPVPESDQRIIRMGRFPAHPGALHHAWFEPKYDIFFYNLREVVDFERIATREDIINPSLVRHLMVPGVWIGDASYQDHNWRIMSAAKTFTEVEVLSFLIAGLDIPIPGREHARGKPSCTLLDLHDHEQVQKVDKLMERLVNSIEGLFNAWSSILIFYTSYWRTDGRVLNRFSRDKTVALGDDTSTVGIGYEDTVCPSFYRYYIWNNTKTSLEDDWTQGRISGGLAPEPVPAFQQLAVLRFYGATAEEYGFKSYDIGQPLD